MDPQFLAILGWIASLFVGLLLGLLGGGGSILTVPVLVYLFGLSATMGTGASLLVVGTSALVAAIAAFRQKDFDLRAGALFALGSVPVLFLVRKILIPALPTQIAQLGSINLTRDKLLMLLFAVLMLIVGARMLKKAPEQSESDAPTKPALLIVLGVGTGILAGLVGAGGGFIIVPALVIGAKLGIKTAVGTSLGVIAVQSLVGFLGAYATLDAPAVRLALGVCGIALIGVFVGRWLTTKLSAASIRPAFAYFVVVMGLFVLAKELISA